MKRSKLFKLSLFLLVCWTHGMCGKYIGRKELWAGGGLYRINYYVVKLGDGTIVLVEPGLVN